MIDLHSHILPGIDDGATELSVSLAMAWQSVDAGVTHMVCTPHIHPGYFDNTKQVIEQTYWQLVHHLAHHQCPLKLAYAAEVRVCAEIMPWINASALPYLGHWQDKPVLLLELPHSHIPAGIENLLRWLTRHQVQVVIAHPERNREIIGNFARLQGLKRLGCLFQVTAGSFMQRFSQGARETAINMLKHNLIDYIASDTHNPDRRPNDMGVCRELITPMVGEAKALELCYTIPQRMTDSLQWH